ncbi:MAG TPA: hypothetical protein ENJ50_07035 [Planctomycetaceae bacterium]|nr:hypothetical protein [Planctomycetaceae bacterium]
MKDGVMWEGERAALWRRRMETAIELVRPWQEEVAWARLFFIRAAERQCWRQIMTLFPSDTACPTATVSPLVAQLEGKSLGTVEKERLQAIAKLAPPQQEQYWQKRDQAERLHSKLETELRRLNRTTRGPVR